MSKADSVHSTPRLNTSPPRPLTSQERGNQLLMRWRLARAAGIPILADLLGSGDFPAEVLDPERAAAIIIERLLDVGFDFVGGAQLRDQFA